MAVDKALLTRANGSDNTREVPLPSGVGTVVVRGLTRKQALKVNGQEMDEGEAERRLLALALVDPAMTEEEIGEWQDLAMAGELVPVVDAVLELSGMTKDAAPVAARRFPD